jgi:hypothetical protein
MGSRPAANPRYLKSGQLASLKKIKKKQVMAKYCMAIQHALMYFLTCKFPKNRRICVISSIYMYRPRSSGMQCRLGYMSNVSCKVRMENSLFIPKNVTNCLLTYSRNEDLSYIPKKGTQENWLCVLKKGQLFIHEKCITHAKILLLCF